MFDRYYYRARFYDPVIARFLSEDIIETLKTDTNLYRYVQNNPILRIDPNGREAILVEIGFQSCVSTSMNNLFYSGQPSKQIDLRIKDPETGKTSVGKGCVLACNGVIGIGSCKKIEPPKCEKSST